jgi:hypothetical protein
MKVWAYFGLVAACGAAVALSVPASAEEVYSPGRATAYSEVLDLPDWTGIWYPDWGRLFGERAIPPKLTPEAQEAYDAYQESIRENGPNQEAQAQCLPPGIPGVMQQPYPIEILYSPGRVTIITEAYEQIRRIYTDGRKLPEDPDLFFNGNSVGFWEDDILVVDTVGLHPETNIAVGIKHTEASHVHEHIYMPGPGELVIEYTITNPEVLAEPYRTKIAYKLDNEFPLREYVCAENNRLQSGENGANIDLGFDHLDDE